MISPGDALRLRRAREREHRASDTPEQREASLYQRRLCDRELFSNFLHAGIDSKYSQRKNSRLFAGSYSLRSSIPDRGCMIHLSNLRGFLGWLVQIQSLCVRSRSPKMPCIRLLEFAGRGCGKLSVTRGFFYVVCTVATVADKCHPSNFHFVFFPNSPPIFHIVLPISKFYFFFPFCASISRFRSPFSRPSR